MLLEDLFTETHGLEPDGTGPDGPYTQTFHSPDNAANGCELMQVLRKLGVI